MTAQETFEDYLIQLQYEAQSLHRQFEGTYVNARFILSEFLETLNANGLNDSLIAVVDAAAFRQELYDYVSLLPESPCLTNVITEFEGKYVGAGNSLSLCSYTTQETILGLTDRVHELIDLGSVLSQEAQNIVVSLIATWNPVVVVEELAYMVRQRLEELSESLYANQGELQAVLEEIERAVTGIPNQIVACSEPVVASVQAASETAQIQAWIC